jgi:hypothetical protein
MTVVSGQSKRFPDASPVTRYWLANCAGFSVSGGGRGTVERVVMDGDPLVPLQLEVRHGNRRHRVPTARVIEIIPAEHVLVVRGSERAVARRAALRQAAVTTGVLGVGLATWLVRAGKETVRLVASLPWQQYGRSVRSGTTTVWREISTTWSRLLTTSSEQSNASRSSERARSTSST